MSLSTEPPASEQKNQVFIGTFIHSKTPTELNYWHDTAIAVSSTGIITAIERDTSECQVLTTLLPRLDWTISYTTIIVAPSTASDAKHQFFFPGMIDTHVHASQYPNIGIFGKSTLLDWLNTYTFPLEASLTNAPKATRIYTACVRRTLSHGTTAASYYATQSASSTAILANVCHSLGQRALIGRVCMDHAGMCPEYYRDESAEEAARATRESVGYIQKLDPSGELVVPVLTPRFAPSCTAEAMKDLGVLAKQLDLPIQTHISENLSECVLVEVMFPEAGSYAKVYDEYGLLTPKTILAHCVHLSEKEVRLLVSRQCKVSHCPGSNTAITSGVARIRWLLDHGLDVGLGTDMGAGYSPSILEAARQAVMASHTLAMGMSDEEEKEKAKLSEEEALYLATKGGAKVLGMEKRVGGFEVGMQWDAIQVKLGIVDESGKRDDDDNAGNVDIFGWESWEEVVAKWLYNGDDRNCKRVWVKGRLVHERK